jgi:hypothetical protein
MSLDAVTRGIAAALGVPASRWATLHVRPGGKGGNSRVYLLTQGGRTLVAKEYFRHPSDRRDRLQAEWTFLEYAVAAGIRSVPRPVARHTASGVGIYEYIAGRNVCSADVSHARVQEAATFFLALNDPAQRQAAEALAAASEACFSIADHLAMVNGRISRLARIPSDSDEDLAARAFVTSLTERWREAYPRRHASLGEGSSRASGRALRLAFGLRFSQCAAAGNGRAVFPGLRVRRLG